MRACVPASGETEVTVIAVRGGTANPARVSGSIPQGSTIRDVLARALVAGLVSAMALLSACASELATRAGSAPPAVEPGTLRISVCRDMLSALVIIADDQGLFAEHGLDPDWYARRERSLDEVLPWDHISVGVSKRFLAEEYQHALQGAVIDDCREHCFSCGILGQFKALRRAAPDAAWGCPPLGRGKERQPVDVRPIPLYYNEEMSPDLAAVAGPRVPQRARRRADLPQPVPK